MNPPGSRIHSRMLAWAFATSSVLRRFPLVLLCTMAGTVSLICSADAHSWNYITFIRVAMTAALGMPLLFSLRMLHERAGCGKTGWLFEFSGVVLLIAYFYMLPGDPNKDRGDWIHADEAPMALWIRWWLLLGALHAVAAASPYLRGAEGNGFWQFNRRLFLRFFTAALFTGVLTIGLELALLSTDKLFELHLRDDNYLRIWFVMTGLFHPVYFLAGVPSDFAALETDTEYPRGLKAFTQFALAPLVGVYTLILYAYAAQILFARNWPRGWVSLPVLILAAVGILAALLLHPLRDRENERWARWFCRNFYRALAPLAILLLFSFQVRIHDYGITEERYMGLVAGGWILAASLVFIVRPRASIRWIPVSLAIIGLVACCGPWGALAVSQASQTRRLTSLLAAHDLLSGGKAVPPPAPKTTTLPSADVENIRSIIDYLDHVHGSATLQTLFGNLGIKQEDFANRWLLANAVLEKLKVKNAENIEPSEGFTLDDKTPIDIQGFRRMFEFAIYQDSRFGEFSVAIKDRDILFGCTDGSVTIPLDAILSKLQAHGTDYTLPATELTVDFACKVRSFRMIFAAITVNKQNGDLTILNSSKVYLLEK
ncbi:MAG: DUF4153 domain-containing protein [Chthoniobacteraceae bacterium]